MALSKLAGTVLALVALVLFAAITRNWRVILAVAGCYLLVAGGWYLRISWFMVTRWPSIHFCIFVGGNLGLPICHSG